MAVGKIKRASELYTFTRAGVVISIRKDINPAGDSYLGQGLARSTRLTIRESGNVEYDETFADLDLDIQEGHRISLVHAGPSQRGHVLGIVNHDTGGATVIEDRAGWLVQGVPPGLGCGLLILTGVMGLSLFIGLGSALGIAKALCLAAIPIIAVLIFLGIGKARSGILKRAIVKHVREMVERVARQSG